MKINKITLYLEEIAETQGFKDDAIPIGKVPFIFSITKRKIIMVEEPKYKNGKIYIKTTLSKEEALKKLTDHHDAVVLTAESLLADEVDPDSPNFHKKVETVRSQTKLDSVIGAAVFNADNELSPNKKEVLYVDDVKFTHPAHSSEIFSMMNVTSKKHGLNSTKVDVSELDDDDRRKLYSLISPVIKMKNKNDKLIRLVLLITKNKLGKICRLKLLPEFIDEFAQKQSSNRNF
ncbi:hypothetical protein ACP3VU_19440 [Vibrio sp. PNB23_22_6]|uniref:hypothetical protein n=1 Tax=unclassified Vibrio TaxID=2614977 RepID=UPI00406A5D64